MKQVTIYTDGACSGNPGPGGWGTILVSHAPLARVEVSGAEVDTTNNRMELMAVLEGLRRLKYPCEVTVVTDSRYVHDMFQKGWITSWKKRGWRLGSKKKQPVKNLDLVRALDEEVAKHEVTWQWVRGHAGHPENERADHLAVSAIRDLLR